MTKHNSTAAVLEAGDLDATKEYDSEITSITNVFVSEFNKAYTKGWSLAALDPRLAMAAGLIKNSTASPWVTDHLLFAGLEMQADLPTEQPVLEFM